jgi:hypothetical protein
MIATQWGEYLKTNGHAAAADIFFDFQPDEPNNCITLYNESAPALPESQALAMDLWGLQVIVRNTSAAQARAKILAIHKAIIGLSGKVGTATVDDVYVVTAPTTIGRDEKNRAEWSAHYTYRTESTGDEFRT